MWFRDVQPLVFGVMFLVHIICPFALFIFSHRIVSVLRITDSDYPLCYIQTLIAYVYHGIFMTGTYIDERALQIDKNDNSLLTCCSFHLILTD